MTTDRERMTAIDKVRDALASFDGARAKFTSPALDAFNEGVTLEYEKAARAFADVVRAQIAELERENEALRKEIDSREAFWAELKRRLPELERENEALREKNRVLTEENTTLSNMVSDLQ